VIFCPFPFSRVGRCGFTGLFVLCPMMRLSFKYYSHQRFQKGRHKNQTFICYYSILYKAKQCRLKIIFSLLFLLTSLLFDFSMIPNTCAVCYMSGMCFTVLRRWSTILIPLIGLNYWPQKHTSVQDFDRHFIAWVVARLISVSLQANHWPLAHTALSHQGPCLLSWISVVLVKLSLPRTWCRKAHIKNSIRLCIHRIYFHLNWATRCD
jgi:hypothetical protein